MNDGYIESSELIGFLAGVLVGLTAVVAFLLLPKIRAVIIGELGVLGRILHRICLVLTPCIAIFAGVLGSSIGCYWAISR